MQAAVPGCFVKRWWGRGPQKSPPETFVRGLAVPPCSTPVTIPKKDPKKLCAFWGFISVPVVGVEPTRCHHQRILSPSRLPIPTHRLICCLYSILQACQKIKIYFALIFTAIPHNSKCRYGERGAADAKPKAQIILDVLSSILATQMPCRSRRSGACRKAGIVRCCLTPQIRSKFTLDIPRIIGLSFFSAVFSLITPVFFQAIGAAKVSVAISVMREIICLIPIFWLLSHLGLGWTWWAFPLSETISGEFGLVFVSAPDPPLAGCVKSQAAEKEFCAAAKPLDIPVLILHNETSKRE